MEFLSTEVLEWLKWEINRLCQLMAENDDSWLQEDGSWRKTTPRDLKFAMSRNNCPI